LHDEQSDISKSIDVCYASKTVTQQLSPRQIMRLIEIGFMQGQLPLLACCYTSAGQQTATEHGKQRQEATPHR
jgi:hypothetical protein